MERLTDHEELQGLLGAYALDAVEPDEAEALERHLTTCPRCRNELADHREVAALLGYAGVPAPSGVWDRIIASLEETPPVFNFTGALTRPAAAVAPEPAADLPVAAAAPTGTAESNIGSQQLDLDAIGGQWGRQTPPSIHARGPEGPGDDSQARGQVVPISSASGRRSAGHGSRPRRSVPMRFMVAIASVAALLVAFLGIEVGRLEVNKSQPQTSLSALAYRAADADPTARHLTLTSADGIHTVRAVIIADGATYLGSGNLPVLPSTETYQMWGIVDGARVSLGVIGENPTYASFTTPAVADTIAMTVETRGGVVASTKAPVVAGVVPTA